MYGRSTELCILMSTAKPRSHQFSICPFPLPSMREPSQTDLGLTPGGRVRLTVSKSIRLGATLTSLTTSKRKTGGMEPSGIVSPAAAAAAALYTAADSVAATAVADTVIANALAFSPNDPNRFMVANSSDQVCHASRLGYPPPPRSFRGPRRPSWGVLGGERSPSSSASVDSKNTRTGHQTARTGSVVGNAHGIDDGQFLSCSGTGGVTCVSFSPFFLRYFLAGCGDGSVRLHKVILELLSYSDRSSADILFRNRYRVSM